MATAIEELVKLRAENEDLRAEIARLTELLTPMDARFTFAGLTPSEHRILSFLFDMSPRHVRSEALFKVGRFEDVQSPERQANVYIHKIRKKLAPFNIRIRTRHAEGYWIDADSKALLSALITKGGAQ